MTEAAEADYRIRAWSAYAPAALSRMKKLPTFEKFVGAPKRKPRRQTPEEMKAAFAQFAGPARMPDQE